MQTQNSKTPIYQPNYHNQLSPRTMWKDDPETKKPDVTPKLPSAKVEQTYAEEGREAYKNLTDDQKNLMCAGIVVSANWRNFLKPLLETYSNPPRKVMKTDADYYELLNNNAVAAFVNELISTLEGRAKRSPSYEHDEE